MSVRPSVRRPTYVRPYVRTSTIKLNAATNQIVVFVKVDETFTTIWLSRSSEVGVKVTWNLKFQKWRFSKSISSAIFQPIKKIPTVSDTRPKYLKSLRPDFWISSSLSSHVTSNFAKNWLRPILMKLLRCYRSTKHLRLYDFQGHPRSGSRWPQSPIGTIFIYVPINSVESVARYVSFQFEQLFAAD